MEEKYADILAANGIESFPVYVRKDPASRPDAPHYNMLLVKPNLDNLFGDATPLSIVQDQNGNVAFAIYEYRREE
ncbi:MAG: hypothetical protein HC945_03000 [Nitrosarchaeum sp.]|nr:hypothetical protein [Nitrosarchaeum sp.]